MLSFEPHSEPSTASITVQDRKGYEHLVDKVVMRKSTSGRKAKSTEHWGQRLSRVLKEHGLSNRAAAKLIGVSPSVVDGWTKGSSPSDLSAVKMLADHLSVSFSWILTGQREKESPKASVAELFQELPYFDGYARIRIDRLMPRDDDKKKEE